MEIYCSSLNQKNDFMKTTKPENIDQYISGFSNNIQNHLREIRSTIKKAAPHAEEAIKYDMPAFYPER